MNQVELPEINILKPQGYYSCGGAYSQDLRFASALSSYRAKGLKYDIDKVCQEELVALKNCGRFSLQKAIIYKDEELIKRIIEASKNCLELSPFGYNSLLFIIKEGAKAYSTVVKLVAAGANVNCALGNIAEGMKGIPKFATPLYIVAERTRHLRTLCFLERRGAICYPAPKRVGKELIQMAHWINGSGLKFYMGARDDLDIPTELRNKILQVCIRLFRAIKWIS